MSLISEQVQKLRDLANDPEIDMYGIKELNDAFRQAADTIETLSAKLYAANMERSSAYYNGGWIPVDERLPEEKGWYLVFAKNQRPFVAYFKGKTFPLNNHYHEIIAWMPLPEPFQELSNSEKNVKYDEDDLEDAMIHASRNAKTIKNDLIDIFYQNGLGGVYNLGQKDMYEYLTKK